MRLIFIRHAEPDYEHDTLTEKGFREADILRERILKWQGIDAVYTSTYPRAYLTAKPALPALGMEAVQVDWLREFQYAITDPTTGKTHVPWDFMPSYWTEQQELFDHRHWYRNPVVSSNPAYEPAVMAMRAGLDGILKTYGYTRYKGYYQTDEARIKDDDALTVLFFAHLGANLEAIGYLLNISPTVLQQTIYLAPTSVCILNAEKRLPGEAMFRAQVLGDTSHLSKAGEIVSASGAFSGVMSEI